jgi:Cu/Ag efflux protein CusF
VVQGRIVTLPEEGSREILIKHEPIPDFVDQNGVTVGMHAMTMMFPLAPGLDISGFKPGDRIEFEYEVRWKSKPHEELVSLKKID